MRHPALPESITPEALGQWIRQNSKESFVDETKIFFSEEEISDMEKESTKYGREIINLLDLKKIITEHLTKGYGEDIEVTIPATAGLKFLLEARESLDRKVDKGYEVVETKIYAIPHEDGQMYFFDIEGNCFEDRTRRLSQREKHEYFGMFVDGSFGNRDIAGNE